MSEDLKKLERLKDKIKVEASKTNQFILGIDEDGYITFYAIKKRTSKINR